MHDIILSRLTRCTRYSGKMVNPRTEKRTIVVAVATASRSLLLYHWARNSHRKKKEHNRKTGRVSHLRIKRPNLSKSGAFYEAFGFELLATNTRNTAIVFAILKCPGEKVHKPYYILLEEDSSSCQRVLRNAANVGIGRFCFAVDDVQSEVGRLKELGYKPAIPIITDKAGSLDEQKEGAKNRNAPL
jgi:hypothetical protein